MSCAQNVEDVFEYVNLFVILEIPILFMPFPAHAEISALYNVNNCWAVYQVLPKLVILPMAPR